MSISPTKMSANLAARYGHLEMVKYLYEVMRIEPTVDGANRAAERGHIEMVKYLYEVMNIKPTNRGATYAAGDGHVEMVKYLIKMKIKRIKRCSIILSIVHYNYYYSCVSYVL